VDKKLELIADAIARNSSDVTPKGFVELKWPDDWDMSEQLAIRKQARAAYDVMTRKEK
jgi:hypothetical protein